MREAIKGFFSGALARLVYVFLLCVMAIPSALKALFFTADEDAEGNVIRTRFSLTRSAFSMATFLVLFRMFFAGWDVERIYISPLENTQKELAAKSKKGPKQQSKKEKLSAWITIKGYKGKPLSSSELWMYLILVALYYFHRDINRGSERGFLQDLIQLYAQANALKNGASSPFPAGVESVLTTPAQATPSPGRKARESQLPSIEKDPFA